MIDINKNRRTIMIFPQFDNIKIIENIREKYDPLFNHVRPHITLAFTFESSLTTMELKKHKKTALENISTFKLTMDEIVKMDNPLGRYLFLLPKEGNEHIKEISSKLYTGLLEKYKPEWLNENTYMPHITIGCFDSSNELNREYEEVSKINESFSTIVNKVFAEIIDKNEDSIVDIEVDMKSNIDKF